MRGPLFESNYRPHFTGHETFPLRYGWLKKAYDAVAATEDAVENKSVFLDDGATVRFGVGKNMVAAIRHWGYAAGILEDVPKGSVIQTTELGEELFADDRLDPYMEHPATLWLIHWQLASRADRTTWFWIFNHYHALTFDREHLVESILRIARERGWPRVSATTVRKDVACFIRTYVPQQPSARAGHDDALESPLTELGLIKGMGRRDGFRFVRGPKATLGDGVFVYALLDFWLGYSKRSATLSFEAVAHQPGSPGRVFQLDENDVADRLAAVDGVTDGQLRWSETAGLKQVVRSLKLNLRENLPYIDVDFANASGLRAA